MVHYNTMNFLLGIFWYLYIFDDNTFFSLDKIIRKINIQTLSRILPDQKESKELEKFPLTGEGRTGVWNSRVISLRPEENSTNRSDFCRLSSFIFEINHVERKKNCARKITFSNLPPPAAAFWKFLQSTRLHTSVPRPFSGSNRLKTLRPIPRDPTGWPNSPERVGVVVHFRATRSRSAVRFRSSPLRRSRRPFPACTRLATHRSWTARRGRPMCPPNTCAILIAGVERQIPVADNSSTDVGPKFKVEKQVAPQLTDGPRPYGRSIAHKKCLAILARLGATV